jgi:hypothetical protein
MKKIRFDKHSLLLLYAATVLPGMGEKIKFETVYAVLNSKVI